MACSGQPYPSPVATAPDRRLEQLAAAPDAAALFFDFDGVLAPIVARPADAALPPATRAELRRLATHYALVAVVSGRPGHDLRRRVGIEGIICVGSHGLELDPQADRWREALTAFAASTPWPAAELERKGLALAFHFRTRPDEHAARRELEPIAAAARAQGLVTRYGRKVLEVLPPVGSHKGTAVRRLLAEHRLRRALVAGDDTTDLDAFAALEGLELALRVAVASPEAPRALLEAADLVVCSADELPALLRRL
jgi:trehalose 6-phosphate phosphatase